MHISWLIPEIFTQKKRYFDATMRKKTISFKIVAKVNP
jgi:hypothetical protein